MLSALIERPWHPLMVLLNTIMPNLYHWKAKTENHIRRSGMNYAIIRPTILKGKLQNTKVTPYEIRQIGHLGGSIERSTLGQIIMEVAKSDNIADKVTFQCTGRTTQPTQLALGKLQPDTEDSIVRANHMTPKYVYGVVLLTLVSYGLYLLMKAITG